MWRSYSSSYSVSVHVSMIHFEIDGHFFMNSTFFFPAMHLFQAVRYRMWWLLPTVCLCGLLEVLGWSARLWSSINPFIVIPFQIQWVNINVQIPPWKLTMWPWWRITCTIIAPTPFIAANFIILGKIVQRLGPAYSRLSPKWCKFICQYYCLNVNF